MDELLLDACVMINLAASGVAFRELAGRSDTAFAMVRHAADEALYVGALCGDSRDKIDVASYARRGDLRIVDLRPAELRTFVDLARNLDDGEAASIAVAFHRGVPLATDDRKARRLAQSMTPPVELVTTAGLLRRWAGDHEPSADHVADAIRNIEIRASFLPGRTSPHRDWWLRAQQ